MPLPRCPLLLLALLPACRGEHLDDCAATGTCPDLETNLLGDGGAGGASSRVEGGAGGAHPTAEPLWLETAELTPAQFNRDYSLDLLATGGDGALTWTLASGALPTGLVLREDGRLAGRPREGGNFSFELTVTAADGQSASRDFTLRVERYPWLAFTANLEQTALTEVYAIDTSRNNLPRTKLSLPFADVVTDQARGARSLAFAPTGDAVAFLADRQEPGVDSLFVAQLDDAGFSTAVELSLAPATVTRFAWSPDGERLALLASSGDPTASSSELNWIDLNAPAPSPAPLGSGTTGDLAWVEPARLLIGNAAGVSEVVWAGDSPGAVTALTLPIGCRGSPMVGTDPTRALVRCSFSGVSLVDLLGVRFTGDEPPFLIGRSAVGFRLSADLSRVALRDYFGTGPFEVLDATPNPTPLLSGPFSSMTGLALSADGQRFAWQDASGRLNLADLEPAAPVTRIVGETSGNLSFSPDARWLAHQRANGTELALVATDPTVASPPELLVPGLFAAESQLQDRLAFAPSSEALVFSAPLEQALDELYLVELLGSAPSSPRLISSGEPTREVVDVRWSMDSSFVLFLEQRTEHAGRLLLHVNLLAATPNAVILAPTACDEWLDCPTVEELAVQPERPR